VKWPEFGLGLQDGAEDAGNTQRRPGISDIALALDLAACQSGHQAHRRCTLDEASLPNILNIKASKMRRGVFVRRFLAACGASPDTFPQELSGIHMRHS
jgi:hypothetical protein